MVFTTSVNTFLRILQKKALKALNTLSLIGLIIMDAFKTMKEYDLMMARLGYIVSETLNEQVSLIVEQEQKDLKVVILICIFNL